MPAQATRTFQHVDYLWDDAVAGQLDPVARLVYRSNLLGKDQRITNTGGGNTSSKLAEQDPLTGQDAEVLWVKGSGGDLRTAKRENFASLYQQKLIGLQHEYLSHPDKGAKTPIEDEMVARYPHCTFNLNPRPASIDTPLHSFVPKDHIDHMHPNAQLPRTLKHSLAKSMATTSSGPRGNAPALTSASSSRTSSKRTPLSRV